MDNTIDLKVFIRQHEEDRQRCRQLLQAVQQNDNPATIQKNVILFWNNELQKHIQEEENRLFPFLTKNQFNNEFLAVLRREHETIRLLAERLPLQQAGDYLYKVFIKLIEQHNAFEDEIVFRKIEEERATPVPVETKRTIQKIRA
jgi:hemerythrin-like domain-containing protein